MLKFNLQPSTEPKNDIMLKFNLQLLAEPNDDITELRNKYVELENKFNEQTILHEQLNQKYSVALENNQKLFLSQTTKIDTTNNDEIEEEVNEYAEHIGVETYNNLSKSEQNLLKTILEGED